MNLVYITKGNSQSIINFLEKTFSKVSIINELSTPDSIIALTPDAVVISVANFDKDAIEKFIYLARRSETCFYYPIFTEKNGSMFLFHKAIPLDNLKLETENIKKLQTEIQHHNYKSWENRILSYFYTRPYFNIEPFLDENNPMFYYYPLIEQFYDGQEDYFYWLEEMVSQNILAKTQLVDRIFCCPYCFSAILKFSDHCPSCGSINIRNERFIHCFTCGFVAPESKFLKDERFVCPSCKSKLKLVGQDYDRPLENGVCNDCGAYHIESKLKVQCLTCKKTCSTEDLSKKFIYEYKLTEHGRNQIKFGTVSSSGIIINSLNYIELNHLIFNLDWAIQMQKRYAEEHFSLIAMKIFLDRESSSYDLIVEFSKVLRQIFRTTDLCSKIDNNSFIFYFPKTDSKALSVVLDRIDSFLKNLESSKGSFHIKTETFSSSQQNIENISAKDLTVQLANKL